MVYTISDRVDDPKKMDKRKNSLKAKDPNKDSFAPNEKWRIWRNVLVLGFAFMIHFTAFWGASNLQSSVNADESLGTFTLAAIYGSLLISNIFLPTIVIKWFGCKWTIALSFLTYMPFMASQFYPRFSTMIPSGLFVGFGGGPLWCAKCTFLSVISEAYAQVTGLSSDMIVTRFFGVFFMFYQFSQVWGNLISSAILSSDSETLTLLENVTTIINNNEDFFTNITSGTLPAEDVLNICGAKFCPSSAVVHSNPNLVPPPSSKINLIAGIYLACMAIACLSVIFGVDSLKRYQGNRTGSAHGLSGFRLLVVTLQQLGNPYQILILPITMFIGAEQAFLAADFNAAFVSCGWGINNIGFVMICFGVSNALTAIFIGGIVKKVGRIPMMVFGLILHMSLLVTLLLWNPSSENKIAFFLIAGLWGVSDAIWLIQINAFCGILFPNKEEAAYSNFRLWESTGSVITYAYNPFLCIKTKIYLLMGLLLIGITGYSVIEVLERNNKKRMFNVDKGDFELVDDESKPSEIPS